MCSDHDGHSRRSATPVSDDTIRTTSSSSVELPLCTISHLAVATDFTMRAMEAIGVSVPPGCRLSRAQSLILRLARESDAGREIFVDREAFADAVRTMIELFIVLRASDASDQLLPQRLATAMGGTDIAAQDSNTAPRDAQFELFVAALLRLSGIQGVHLGEPDVRVPAGRETLGISVKRLTSTKQLTKRLRKAVDQIQKQGQRGMVVLNLDAFVAGADDTAARRIVKAETARCRDTILSLANGDAAFGVCGVALLPQWDGQAEARFVGPYVPFSIEIIAPPEEHERIAEFLNTLGRNIVRALQQEATWLQSQPFTVR